MKRLLSVFALFALILSFNACKPQGGNAPEATPETPVVEEKAPEAAPEAAPTETPPAQEAPAH